MLEKIVERYLVKKVRELGGQCWKWTGTTGAPDRIVFLQSRVLFVEVKTKGGRLSEIQKHIHKVMGALGHDVHVVWSKKDVDRLLE